MNAGADNMEMCSSLSHSTAGGSFWRGGFFEITIKKKTKDQNLYFSIRHKGTAGSFREDRRMFAARWEPARMWCPVLHSPLGQINLFRLEFQPSNSFRSMFMFVWSRSVCFWSLVGNFNRLRPSKPPQNRTFSKESGISFSGENPSFFCPLNLVFGGYMRML